VVRRTAQALIKFTLTIQNGGMRMSQLIYELLNVHVHAADETVIEQLASRLVKGHDSLTPELEKAVLDAHHDARRLFNEWRF